MASNYYESLISEADPVGTQVTKCPLCYAPITGNRDQLQLHYLTRCPNYDKVSLTNEEPLSKYPGRGEEPVAQALATEPPQRIDTVWSGTAHALPTASGEHDCNVMFMWQPLNQILSPSVTLLASFQSGSVELKRDSEGCHFASTFISITKGTYEGQLVSATSDFFHPVKPFQVVNNDDIIILQFPGDTGENRGYGDDYNMQSNPSYDAEVTPGSAANQHPALGSYSTSQMSKVYGSALYYDNNGTAALRPSSQEAGIGRTEVPGSRFSADFLNEHDQSRNITGAAGRSIRTVPDSQPLTRPSSNQAESHRTATAHEVSHSPACGKNKAQWQRQHQERDLYGEFHGGDGGDSAAINTSTTASTSAPATWPTSSAKFLDSLPDLEQIPESERRGERAGACGNGSLREQLEEVTRERDRLRVNEGKIVATWKRRVKFLEKRLEQVPGAGGWQQAQESAAGTSSSGSSAERTDRDAVLQEQIQVYEHAIKQRNMLVQNFTDNGEQTRLRLLDFTKKQQVEQDGSFATIKKEIESVIRVYDEYIKLSQSNIILAAELQDYQEQTKFLLGDIKQKDDEIKKLKEPLEDMSNDRLLLEIETMKQKHEGWKDEVQRLLPLESEVKRLGELNAELSQQLVLMVEEGECKQEVAEGASGKKNVIDYDSLVDRLTFLQETRVTMEEELARLREERASILQENASLREGSQPQLYAKLKTRYEETTARLKAVSASCKEQKKASEQLEATNVELHQKLVKATDQNMLKTIQERLDRYKKERDTARVDCDELDSKLAVALTDLHSAREYAEGQEKEATRLKAELLKLETRVRSYREERNMAKERLKELEHRTREQQPHHHLHHHSSSNMVLPTAAWHEEGMRDLEHSLSPSRDYPYSTAGLSYMSDQYPISSESHYSQPHHQDAESPTLSDDSVSPSPLTAANLHVKSKSSEPFSQSSKPMCESPSTLGSHNNTVEVKTKEGVVIMDIQRPSAKLAPKYKPQVVVKRSEGYEAGTLMYLGRLNDKEIAGVYMDRRCSKVTGLMSGPAAQDGTFKDGKRYFKCPIGHGLYTSLSKIYIGIESATV